MIGGYERGTVVHTLTVCQGGLDTVDRCDPSAVQHSDDWRACQLRHQTVIGNLQGFYTTRATRLSDHPARRDAHQCAPLFKHTSVRTHVERAVMFVLSDEAPRRWTSGRIVRARSLLFCAAVGFCALKRVEANHLESPCAATFPMMYAR